MHKVMSFWFYGVTNERKSASIRLTFAALSAVGFSFGEGSDQELLGMSPYRLTICLPTPFVGILQLHRFFYKKDFKFNDVKKWKNFGFNESKG